MEQKIRKNYLLSNRDKKLMFFLAKLIGVGEFVLYGSTPVSLIMKGNCMANDYDLAIPGKTEENIIKVKRFLKKNGFKIIKSNRKYYIYQKIEVISLYAQKERILLDICFMDEISLIGQFNIESLYWRYPEMDCIDKYGTIEALRNKKIVSIRGLNNENIFLLTSRFIYLCSKYQISLTNKESQKIVKFINKKLCKENSYKTDQYISCLSSILKSILTAKDRMAFIEELINSEIVKNFFKELHSSLINLVKENKQFSLLEVKNKGDLINLLEKNMHENNKKEFIKKINMLTKRKWDKQDKTIKIKK
ncbi:MAG: hypothetical protein PHQ01_02130 [Candidatus Pacebacteria bacterium]|nr:hypothetical protein [Candidatus Paceibacterota bacterium]